MKYFKPFVGFLKNLYQNCKQENVKTVFKKKINNISIYTSTMINSFEKCTKTDLKNKKLHVYQNIINV